MINFVPLSDSVLIVNILFVYFDDRSDFQVVCNVLIHLNIFLYHIAIETINVVNFILAA